MNDLDPNLNPENETFPIEPRYHPLNKVLRKIFDGLASSRLALALLVAILLCCIIGVTIYREERATALIFGTLWFNGILVLLIVNVACCFFGRIWGRRVTIISFGMILFHLSFITMFAGIIYNSLFYFRGTIRLTEGETLPNGDPQSYDATDRGLLFKYSKFKGETTLTKVESGYKVDGLDKRAGYQISVGEGHFKKNETIYVTKHLEYKGFKYFPDKLGYSLLLVLYDKQGKELYGAYIPLQTFMLKNNTYLNTSGSKEGPGSFWFPQKPEKTLLDIQAAYRPDLKKDRAGEVEFQVRPHSGDTVEHDKGAYKESKSPIGTKLDVGDYYLSAKAVHYWAGLRVVYEPGQPIVLSSMWVGLSGLFITFYGRIRRRRK
jgi:cytochrome c biogenesis protein ResB